MGMDNLLHLSEQRAGVRLKRPIKVPHRQMRAVKDQIDAAEAENAALHEQVNLLRARLNAHAQEWSKERKDLEDAVNDLTVRVVNLTFIFQTLYPITPEQQRTLAEAREAYLRTKSSGAATGSAQGGMTPAI